MVKWEEKKFKDFIKLNRGFDLPNDKMITGKFPVVASTSIKGYHNEYKVNAPVVVTGRSGSLGEVQYIDMNCVPLNTTLYVKDYKGNEPKYIYYFLKTIHLEAFNSGAGVPTLNQNHLHSLKIKVPDISTQKRITYILSTYDDLIENNNRRIALLEKAAQDLYTEWFVRFRFPGHEKAKFEGGLPVGWSVKRLGEYGQVETGKTPSTAISENYGNEIMFVKTPDMHGNTYIIKTEEMLSEEGHRTQPKKLLPPNSIMVSCIGTGGVVAINALPAHTNQQINSIILSDCKYLEWLYFTCKSLKATIELFGATGATMTNLSKGKFEKLKIANPPQSLIYDYHDKTADIFLCMKQLLQQTQNLKKQRDLLLPRLMSGIDEL